MKETAQELFNQHYFILFDSESDKGQEILISLLAKKAAILTAETVCLHAVLLEDKVKWARVVTELNKM